MLKRLLTFKLCGKKCCWEIIKRHNLPKCLNLRAVGNIFIYFLTILEKNILPYLSKIYEYHTPISDYSDVVGSCFKIKYR